MGRKEDLESLKLAQEREKELSEPEVAAVVSFRLFDAMLDSDTRLNHRVLDGGIAPATWAGWKIYAPPLGPGCRCTLIGVTASWAAELLGRGRPYFDLTKGVPAGAGPDAGWSKDPATWPEEIEDPVHAMTEDEARALELFEEIKGILSDNPGILQAKLYKLLPEMHRQDVSYALWAAAKHGRLVRSKAGNTYALRLP